MIAGIDQYFRRPESSLGLLVWPLRIRVLDLRISREGKVRLYLENRRPQLDVVGTTVMVCLVRKTA